VSGFFDGAPDRLVLPDGASLAYGCFGAPYGAPAVFLHGGPGGGTSRGALGFFDLARDRVVVFDQRGCGRSRPLADQPGDVGDQSLDQLVDDLERLRARLGFARWLVVGVSWGCTLGMAYAAAHPDRVSGLVFAAVNLATARDVRWMTEDLRAVFPVAWRALRAAVRADLADLPLVDAYALMLTDPDLNIRAAAAAAWCAWEDAHVSLSPGHQPYAGFDEPAFRERFARLVTHHWRTAAAPQRERALTASDQWGKLPAAFIHGRYDISSPLETVLALVDRWPRATLQVLEHTGHGGPGEFPEAVRAAVARLQAAATSA
jgi:proline iminopeptidase